MKKSATDLSELLRSTPWAELDEAEKAFVLRILGSSEKYEALRIRLEVFADQPLPKPSETLHKRVSGSFDHYFNTSRKARTIPFHKRKSSVKYIIGLAAAAAILLFVALWMPTEKTMQKRHLAELRQHDTTARSPSVQTQTSKNEKEFKTQSAPESESLTQASDSERAGIAQAVKNTAITRPEPMRNVKSEMAETESRVRTEANAENATRTDKFGAAIETDNMEVAREDAALQNETFTAENYRDSLTKSRDKAPATQEANATNRVANQKLKENRKKLQTVQSVVFPLPDHYISW